MFGYAKHTPNIRQTYAKHTPRPELEGKNVAMLMPPPFSMQHHTFLRSYKQTQKGNLLGTGPREVIALHREGYVFPVKIIIEKSVGAEGYTGVIIEVCFSSKSALNMKEMDVSINEI